MAARNSYATTGTKVISTPAKSRHRRLYALWLNKRGKYPRQYWRA